MVNSIQLTWMLRIYWTYNLTMRFLKYKFYNKLLGGIILLRITLRVTWTKFYRRSGIVLRCDRASVNSSSFVLLWFFFFFFLGQMLWSIITCCTAQAQPSTCYFGLDGVGLDIDGLSSLERPKLVSPFLGTFLNKIYALKLINVSFIVVTINI